MSQGNNIVAATQTQETLAAAAIVAQAPVAQAPVAQAPVAQAPKSQAASNIEAETAEASLKQAPVLRVRAIVSSKDGFSHVIVSRATFDLTAGFRPQMEYTTGRNKAGQGVRVFTFADGAKLYSIFDKGTKFIMGTAEAEAHLSTVEEEYEATSSVLAFSNIDSFVAEAR